MSTKPKRELPWQPYPKELPPEEPKAEKQCSLSLLLVIVCVAIAATMLLTYSLTWIYVRDRYVGHIQDQAVLLGEKDREIALLERDKLLLEQALASGGGTEFQKLSYLSTLFRYYSYYTDTMDREEMLDAVLKAYADATGDRYAEYYTEEEYAELMRDNAGSSVGIGVSVVQTDIKIGGVESPVYQIISIYRNSAAEQSALRVGDYIAGVKIDGAYKTVAELGYAAFLDSIRGDAGTVVELIAYRASNNDYQPIECALTRAEFVKESVSARLSESDPKVGIVHIAEFDMTTPVQLKQAVNGLLESGAEKFVFDVRNNPGGDLQSVKAVLTYFLQAGDLIISAIDRNGNTARSYYAEAQTLNGTYAPCSISPEEVGMYADLDMVVLCNENTASAAEAFTSALRDNNQTPVVGQTTFGKGVMQSYISLGAHSFGLYDGWVKMTTYAYVTASGVSYHDIGILPDTAVELSDEAKSYNIYVLPESLDDQLLAAIAHLNQ